MNCNVLLLTFWEILLGYASAVTLACKALMRIWRKLKSKLNETPYIRAEGYNDL